MAIAELLLRRGIATVLGSVRHEVRVSTEVIAVPGVKITSYSFPTRARPHETKSWSITVRNTGDITLDKVQAFIYFDSGPYYVYIRGRKVSPGSGVKVGEWLYVKPGESKTTSGSITFYKTGTYRFRLIAVGIYT